MPEMMGIAAYAEHRNVSEDSVRAAIKSGRIKCKHYNGRRVIEAEQADKDWTENAVKDPPNIPEEKKSPSMMDARVAYQTLKAQLAKVDLDERTKKLVPADKVKDEAVAVAHAVRDAMRQIPLKISAEVAAETDPHRVEIILQKEIDEALTELSRMSFE